MGFCECDIVTTPTYREHYKIYNFDGTEIGKCSETICGRCKKPQRQGFIRKY